MPSYSPDPDVALLRARAALRRPLARLPVPLPPADDRCAFLRPGAPDPATLLRRARSDRRVPCSDRRARDVHGRPDTRARTRRDRARAGSDRVVVNTDRYDHERRQGELIAAGEEHVWGWSGPAGAHPRRAAGAAPDRAGASSGPASAASSSAAAPASSPTRLVESGCELVAVELSEATAAIARERVGDRARGRRREHRDGRGARRARVRRDRRRQRPAPRRPRRAASSTRSRICGRAAASRSASRTSPNPQVWAERRIERRAPARHVTPHETAFRAGDLRARFEAAGLDVELCRPFEFLHPATPRRLIGAVERARASCRADAATRDRRLDRGRRPGVRSSTTRLRNAARRPSAGVSARSTALSGR